MWLLRLSQFGLISFACTSPHKNDQVVFLFKGLLANVSQSYLDTMRVVLHDSMLEIQKMTANNMKYLRRLLYAIATKFLCKKLVVLNYSLPFSWNSSSFSLSLFAIDFFKIKNLKHEEILKILPYLNFTKSDSTLKKSPY